jgi:Uncharacterized protein, probably involved in trehalose biosynthesis
VLKTYDGFTVIDFEGEPARPLAERRAKVCPLKDVAGMLRSFNYAAHTILKRHPSLIEAGSGIVMEWERAARTAFLDGYRSIAIPGRAMFLPMQWAETMRVLRVYELDKAIYELRYELRNRPDWLSIPRPGHSKSDPRSCRVRRRIPVCFAPRHKPAAEGRAGKE